ncbi:MAG: sulfotransferase domain-containing protein [Leptolyngbya sp. SIO1D8]|nr:sulfotransferase domain-containing protein [Leptolyngbya sp. SIO1D8]
MHWLQRLGARPKFFYVISHERSGTHFLINCLKLNTSIDLKYQSAGEWFGPFEKSQAQFNHIEKKLSNLSSKNYYVLKSHCDRDLFEKAYLKGKIIYIFRDYRDVLTSYYHFLQDGYLDWAQQHNSDIKSVWFSNFSDFIRKPAPNFLRFNYSLHGNFSTPLERWDNHVMKWISSPSKNIQVVTYNQLYFDAEKTTRKLLKFLNLPCKRSFTHPNFENAYSVMPRKGIIGDWKNQLSTEDKAFLESAIANKLPLLNQFPWESSLTAS